jgi:excinuclease ABC subunit B
MSKLKVISEFTVSEDQKNAVSDLVDGINSNKKFQTLLGVTGSGKTFTMAKVIESIQKPSLILTHNKTLAAQLYREFSDFFPENAVEYFVSYYDYYQPEAYISSSDLYIEKDASINDEIDRMRLKATTSILSRKDVIVVSSVSCIYGLGTPEDYEKRHILLNVGDTIERDDFLRKLVSIYYDRNDISFIRGNFRVRGDTVEVFPAYMTGEAYRVEFFGDEIENIFSINSVSGNVIKTLESIDIYPAKHFVSSPENMEETIKMIREELEERLLALKKEDKIVEAERLRSRTNYDIEMLLEVGYCNGIENYSRIISRREAGVRPQCLLDYFKNDFLMFVDESHVALPQVRGMYGGDRSRKMNLVDYGFRLPSALDNRPLFFDEFIDIIPQMVFISATPGEYELEKSDGYVEQIIRPTGLLDPEIIVKPATNQIDDLIKEVNLRVEKNERVLVTTMTKKMAEDLAVYVEEMGIKSKYLHSEIDTIQRVEILRDLRKGEFDCLIGINLLREGLDLPEVSLVIILDADKEGFLRSAKSLIQTSGRAARNINGTVIMYADKITNSMEIAISETKRRRKIQNEYNIKHNITPTTIKKNIVDIIKREYLEEDKYSIKVAEYKSEYNMGNIEDLGKYKLRLNDDMIEAADKLDFESAAILRDKMNSISKKINMLGKKK